MGILSPKESVVPTRKAPFFFLDAFSHGRVAVTTGGGRGAARESGFSSSSLVERVFSGINLSIPPVGSRGELI